MKIIRNMPDQLILEDNPVLFSVFVSVFSLAFVAMGLFVMTDEPIAGTAMVVGGIVGGGVFVAAFVRRTQLILDRGRDLVELRRKSVFGLKNRTWRLSDLDRSERQTSRSNNRDTHRAALVFARGMEAGTYPVTVVYTSGSGPGHAVNAINDWLAATPLDSGGTTR